MSTRKSKETTSGGRSFGRAMLLGTLSGLKSFLTRCRWLLLTAALGILFSAGHFAGAVQKEEELLRVKAITAERYELLGPDGRKSALLCLDPDGQARLSFFDQKGDLRLGIGLDRSGSPSINLFGDDHSLKVGLGLGPDDGMPALQFFDDQRNGVMSLDMTKEFGPGISVGNPGQGHISIGFSLQGEPTIGFWRTKNDLRIQLSILEDIPVISLLDKNHVLRTTWKILPGGSPAFSLSDDRSRERLVITLDKDSKPVIRLIDPDRNEAREIR